jgi:glutaredoxin-like YruB-family protein
VRRIAALTPFEERNMDTEAAAGKPETTFPKVTVYTSNDCRWCGRAKEYLSERGVPYTEKNVEDDESVAMEALSLAGRRATPIIAVGTTVIVGFKQQELDEALGVSAPGASS